MSKHQVGSRGSKLSVALAGAVFAVAGCAPQQYRISVAPSLRPVDSGRSMVVFSQIQGKACGRDAVLGAIRDMKRLNGVDGYIEVVVEETGSGDGRCAKVTAYPFRYGESTDLPVVRAGEESLQPLRVPGHDQGGGSPPPAGSVDCDLTCGEVAAQVEPAAIKQALVKDRCMQRCSADEPGFRSCIAAASTAVAASACLQPEGSAAPAGEER